MDRVEIFKELSLNELREYDASLAENLIGDYYDAFSEFCSFLKSSNVEIQKPNGEKESVVKTVSCSINDDGVHFELRLCNGEEKEVFMSKDREKDFQEVRKTY